MNPRLQETFCDSKCANNNDVLHSPVTEYIKRALHILSHLIHTVEEETKAWNN